MTKKLQDYITPIVGALVTILLSLVSDFLLKLPTQYTWLTFFIGATITTSITLLEQRLLSANSEEINHKLEIYRLLDTIQDEELKRQGYTVLEECRAELANLAEGILRIQAPELFQYLIKTSVTVKRQILGINIGLMSWHKNLYDNTLEGTKTAGEQQWYECKLKLIKRHIRIERIYILPRATLIDPETSQLYSEIRKYLEKQQNDSILIIVVWLEDIDKPDLIQDISIFDDNVALVVHPAWTAGFNEITVFKNDLDIEKYTNLYYAVRAKGHPLREIEFTH